MILAVMIIAVTVLSSCTNNVAQNNNNSNENQTMNNTGGQDNQGPGIPSNETEGNLTKYYCTNESRSADVCYELFQPVCGWFNPEKVQCIKYPCAKTYSNACFACQNTDVLYYTQGECPTG